MPGGAPFETRHLPRGINGLSSLINDSEQGRRKSSFWRRVQSIDAAFSLTRVAGDTTLHA
jgi:hypothetical protein